MKAIAEKLLQRYRTYGGKTLVRSVYGKLRSKMLDPQWPAYDQREVDALMEVLKSRNWGGFPYPGKHTARFAKSFAEYQDARHGICCNSGSTALIVALKAAGIGRGDEVLVPALTFAATATAAFEVGARPVFVDIDPDTFCIDASLIREKITPRTRAIIPVHLGARMADMDKIVELARAHDLKVIEDAAHMHGGKWKQRGAGALGDLGCFSFQSSKTMTAGEGGMIITNDDELAVRCHAYVNCGRVPDGMPLQSILGTNLRITEFQAALLSVQLERFSELSGLRTRNYQLFDELLATIDGVSALRRDDRMTTYSGYGYYFKYIPELCGGVSRERFMVDLKGQGIVAEPGWKPVYQSVEFGCHDPAVQASYAEVRCPVAERIANAQAIWMPHYRFLAKREEIERMAGVIRHLVVGYRRKPGVEMHGHRRLEVRPGGI